MQWKPLAQLVRLPNVFTAAADSLAGLLIAGATLADVRLAWPVPLASMAIYAAGMALNDVSDRELDRIERPSRPLPSGRVRVAVAWLLVFALFLAALALLAATRRERTLTTGLVLIGCVAAYDLFLRRTPLGPIVMGSCRGLNLALGLSLDPNFGGLSGIVGALGFGLFVAGITWISWGEVQGGRGPALLGGRMAQRFGLVAVLAASALALQPLSRTSALIHGIAALAGWLVAAYRTENAGRRAWLEPTGQRLEQAVRAGIFSLIWIDFALAAAAAGGAACLLVACWLPARLSGKWVYST